MKQPLFYRISNWIIVATVFVSVTGYFAGEPFGYFSLSALIFPKVFPFVTLISGFIGVGFALWQHKWKPMLYGLLWALPCFLIMAAIIIPNLRWG